MFYTRTGRTACVYVERFRVSVTQHACACVLVCVFLWVPRTVPHQSQNKFRAPLGYRGLVLGLNVSYFFGVLWVLPMEHVQRKLDQAEVADIITSH